VTVADSAVDDCHVFIWRNPVDKRRHFLQKRVVFLKLVEQRRLVVE
jgi:hypothetical protein